MIYGFLLEYYVNYYIYVYIYIGRRYVNNISIFLSGGEILLLVEIIKLLGERVSCGEKSN